MFAVFGDGQYKIQPIYVDDLALLAIEHGRHEDNVTVDAIGPETLTYRELVEAVGRADRQETAYHQHFPKARPTIWPFDWSRSKGCHHNVGGGPWVDGKTGCVRSHSQREQPN